MKILDNYDIYSHNTMKLHCIARRYYEPESEPELGALVAEFKRSDEKYYVLGCGSNIIFPDRLNTSLISMMSVNRTIDIQGNRVSAGASVRIQTLIRTCQQSSLGGLEYLFSVPCNVGGAVYMNAGGGRRHGNSISDYIETIEFFDPECGQIKTINKQSAEFSYRNSIFQRKEWIILQVVFHFPSSTYEEVEERINARIKYAKEKQAGNLPSCGSIFNQCNLRIMHLLKGLTIGGACWSKKTTNWISNNGNATAKDINMLILIAKLMHMITFQKYKLEVKILK